ncbi:MAG TPA: FmdB family zinc ribbon protein [Pyrinomonadaceae bacterium]|jgi:putative FmdB family regulatory protein
MPIYEYECRKCKAHIEILQKMTDKPLVKCRKCGGRLEKQWSQSGFQFKGSGWYVTDYAGKKTGGKEEKANADSESKAADNSAAKETAATKETSATTKETATTKKSSGKKSASSNPTGGD